MPRLAFATFEASHFYLLIRAPPSRQYYSGDIDCHISG